MDSIANHYLAIGFAIIFSFSLMCFLEYKRKKKENQHVKFSKGGDVYKPSLKEEAYLDLSAYLKKGSKEMKIYHYLKVYGGLTKKNAADNLQVDNLKSIVYHLNKKIEGKGEVVNYNKETSTYELKKNE